MVAIVIGDGGSLNVSTMGESDGTPDVASPGVIARSSSPLIVRVVEPCTALTVAVIVVEPGATPVATLPAIVATPEALDVHVADAVTSSVVASDNVAVAANACVVLGSIAGFAGVTAIDAIAAGVTVNIVVPAIAPSCAVIVTGPPATAAVAVPREPAAFESARSWCSLVSTSRAS